MIILSLTGRYNFRQLPSPHDTLFASLSLSHHFCAYCVKRKFFEHRTILSFECILFVFQFIGEHFHWFGWMRQSDIYHFFRHMFRLSRIMSKCFLVHRFFLYLYPAPMYNGHVELQNARHSSRNSIRIQRPVDQHWHGMAPQSFRLTLLRQFAHSMQHIRENLDR